jgi:hypothetical protein
MAKDSMSDVITIGIIAAIGIGLYEWLKSACASGGNMAGSQICSGYNSLFGPATAAAPSTGTTPATHPASQSTGQSTSQSANQTSCPTGTIWDATTLQCMAPSGAGGAGDSNTQTGGDSTQAGGAGDSNTQAGGASTQTGSPATCLLPPGYFAIATDMGMDTNGNVIYAPGCVAPGSSQSASSQPSVTAAELLAQAVANPVPQSGGSFGGSNPNNNVDIWSYYYQQQTGTAISPGTLQAAFPYLTSSNRGSMTASAFLNAIQGQGMSGLGASPNLIPASLIHRRSRGQVGIPMVLWRARA